MSYLFHCPKCNKKLFEYNGVPTRYGYMIKECKKCGSKYVDPRVTEMALQGIPYKDFNITSFMFLIVIGGFFVYRGFDLYGMEMLGMPGFFQPVLPTLCLLIGLAFIIFAIIEIIRIKTGSKIKKYKRLYNESLRRLKDPGYITELHMLGYEIPEEIKQRIIYEREEK